MKQRLVPHIASRSRHADVIRTMVAKWESSTLAQRQKSRLVDATRRWGFLDAYLQPVCVQPTIGLSGLSR